jgi:hyperosmotically inducible periplasmic protein
MLRKSAILCAVVAVLTFGSGCSQTDSGMTASVKAQLAADNTVKASQMDVTTLDHTVTLTGTVDSAAARERALEIARNTKGVRTVVNNLSVADEVAPTSGMETPAPTDMPADMPREGNQGTASKAKEKTKEAGEVVTDAAITTAVKTKLLGDTKTPGLKIDVDTKDGIVTLSGEVATAAERTNAAKLAQDTKGVKKVVNKLTIAKK